MISDTIQRHIAMLCLIPGRPGKITARAIHEKLVVQGFDTHMRSIERDLPKLSAFFPLVNDKGRPAGWSWEAKAARVTFPCMDAGTALTYELLARYLAPILPRGMHKQLAPEFEQARRVLNTLGTSPVGRWSKRIAVLPTSHQLLPPDVQQDVIDIVYGALLNGKQFEADYRPVVAPTAKRYLFNPLGLVYRTGVLYLVASLWGYDEPRQFALQRMSNAKLLDESAVTPKDFDFERYIREEKAFDFPAGRDIRLELRVDAWLAHHLQESRLSEDQAIAPIRGSENFRVAATLTDTDQLFWWLCSLGTSVEILKPLTLRRRMAGQVKALAERYG